MVSSSSHVFSNSTLVEVLDDLCVRFIINLPAEELGTAERVCFQIEEAQWYYEDFVRDHNPSFPTLNLRQFSAKIFQHCPSLQEWKDQHEEAFAQFMAYKTRVPVRGAILLDPDLEHCVLVKGMKTSASWSFPRGKINQNEKDEDCAVREVYEEIGFDAVDMIQPEDFIESNMRNQNVKLYIVPGVPLDTAFKPRTRNEIGTIQWHNLTELPHFTKGAKHKEQIRTGKFYMVTPFLKELKRWISIKGAQWLEAQESLPNKENIAPKPIKTAVQSDFASDVTTIQESSASLRSLLGIHHHRDVDSDDPSIKLMSFLRTHEEKGEGTQMQQLSHPPTNGQILLSLLKNGTSNQTNDHSLSQGAIPGSIKILSRNDNPGTPTQHPAVPYPAFLQHPNRSTPNRAGQRQPLSPLQDSRSPEEQSFSIYDRPPSPAPNLSLHMSNDKSYEHVVLSSFQPPQPQHTLSEQALFQMLKSGCAPDAHPSSSTYSQTPSAQQSPSGPSQQPQKPLDPEHSKSLLSILKGEKSPPRPVAATQAALPAVAVTNLPHQTTSEHSRALLSILKGASHSSASAAPTSETLPPESSPTLKGRTKSVVQPQQKLQPDRPPLTPKTKKTQVFIPASVGPIPKAKGYVPQAPTKEAKAISSDPTQPAAASPPRGPRGAIMAPKLAVTNAYRVKQTKDNAGSLDPRVPVSSAMEEIPAPTQQSSTSSATGNITHPPYTHNVYPGYGGSSLRGVAPITSVIPPTFDKRGSMNSERQQTLLALFKKPSKPSLKLAANASPTAVATTEAMNAALPVPTPAPAPAAAPIPEPEPAVMSAPQDKGKGPVRSLTFPLQATAKQPAQQVPVKMTTGGVALGFTASGLGIGGSTTESNTTKPMAAMPPGCASGVGSVTASSSRNNINLTVSEKASPAAVRKDAFLLSYLEGVAKGAGK